MAKARSDKKVGFWGDAVNFVQDTARDVTNQVTEALKPEPGSLGDKIMNPRKYRDKEIDAAVTPPKPKPKPTTPQTKNQQLAKDEKRSKHLTKKQVADIRERLKKGETVKTEEY